MHDLQLMSFITLIDESHVSHVYALFYNSNIELSMYISIIPVTLPYQHDLKQATMENGKFV